MICSAPEHPEGSLLELLRLLKQRNYRFITPTPATHARILARPGRQIARTLEDVLGWSLPFGPGVLPADIERCLSGAGMLFATASGLKSQIRVSWLGGNLYLHSAYPTNESDAVFFGPDSYRFSALIERELKQDPPPEQARIVDIGTGAGIGAITAALLCPSASVAMTDINGTALRLAALNAQAAGVDVQKCETRALDDVGEQFDVAMINPPYIIDGDKRAYRDGGAMYGAELSFELTRSALNRIRLGGRVILYTGTAIIGGHDALQSRLITLAAAVGASVFYQEIDPDVFGEELSNPQYGTVERIALVHCVLRIPLIPADTPNRVQAYSGPAADPRALSG